MESILRGYQVNAPTWLYLSCLLIVAVFFRFTRLWSVRNLDLLLLLLITPGLLAVRAYPGTGFVWLFGVLALLLGRTLLDRLLVRRPKLESNMNASGLAFLCAATFVFLMTKMITDPPHPGTVASVHRADQMLNGQQQVQPPATTEDRPAGPASPLITAPVVQISRAGGWDLERVATRMVVLLAHLAVVLGLVVVGRELYGDINAGLSMATLYLLLPCTAYDVGKAMHVLPAALIVWAIRGYRQPLVSGTLLGLACGVLFFPIFLLPLWCAFYGWRGTLRFVSAVTVVAGVLVSIQLLTTPDSHGFLRQTLGYLEWDELPIVSRAVTTAGFWSTHEAAWRVPVFVSYLVMLVATAMWPRKKNLANLIAGSASLVLGIQFWYLQQGGIYVLWYLPVLLLVMFRPALTNHPAPEIAALLWTRTVKSTEPPRPALAG